MRGLTGGDARANVHGSHLGPDGLGTGEISSLLLLGAGLGDDGALGDAASAGAGGGLLVVVDDDADARTLLAGAELHLGALDEGGLGEPQGAVEAVDVALGYLGIILPRRDLLLAHALQSRDLLCLGSPLVLVT